MRFWKIAIIIIVVLCFVSCSVGFTEKTAGNNPETVTKISFDGSKVFVEGKRVGWSKKNVVYIAKDIVYYETGKDFTYGEGSENDAHTKEEAHSHTVVHITQPGIYELSGKLSKGQVSVDLGEEAKNNPDAVVTLILNNVEVTCDIAPAIIFYNVYECNKNTEENTSPDVNTESAGANIVIADNTLNTITGSYVAYIFNPDTLVMNEDHSSISAGEKLHDYDATIQSKMSMNINAEENGSGVLNVNAKNEGIESNCHLTINGGNINIVSGDDGINANLDAISALTINGGNINVFVSGEEGDTTDSNGWTVINGGNLIGVSSSNIEDCCMDSYLDILINGGSVITSGNMRDYIQDGRQNYVVFEFSKMQNKDSKFILKNDDGEIVFKTNIINEYQILTYSSPELREGTYTLWCGEKQQMGQRLGGRNWNDVIEDVPSKEFVIKNGANLFGNVV